MELEDMQNYDNFNVQALSKYRYNLRNLIQDTRKYYFKMNTSLFA